MHPNLKLLVDALRSGDYIQETHRLHGPCGFCVAGVACDLYLKATGGKWEEGPKEAYFFTVGKTKYDTTIPVEVIHWLGLTETDDKRNDLTIGKTKRVDLYRANDAYRLSFNRIADLIEEEIRVY